MDFCLRGSQINLVSRQKRKPKLSTYTNLHHIVAHDRPRSATHFRKRVHSSPFLCRPHSADPKYDRAIASSIGHYCNESDFSVVQKLNKNYKRFQSASSSNLLKLLLDEPIKRSWLCRSGSSLDNQSVLSSSRKTASYSSLSRRDRTESACGSSLEGDNCEKLQGHFTSLSANSQRKKPIATAMSTQMKGKTNFENKSHLDDVCFPENGAVYCLQSTVKPDLPGRVSFCKNNAPNEIDFSDCDNDKQEQYSQFALNKADLNEEQSISAPGPMDLPSFSEPVKLQSKFTVHESYASGLVKKSVHFGIGDVEGVVAETYEYPKCPSENCSCSTRSSSTASIHETSESKCACAMPTCKFSMETNKKLSLVDKECLKPSTEYKVEPKITPMTDSERVIREYKNAVGEPVQNSVVRDILEEEKPKMVDFGPLYNNAYLDKYSISVKTDVKLDKQNNLSEGNQLPNFRSPTKQNSISNSANERIQTDIFTSSLSSHSTMPSTSEAVINNYLKVITPASLSAKKEFNIKPSSADSLTVDNKKENRSPIESNGASFKNKTANDYSRESIKLKKSQSFSSLREDFNLNEFHMEKVDSWMSMHQKDMTKSLSQQRLPDSELEKLRKESLDLMLDTVNVDQADSSSRASTKSDVNSQEDSTYDEIVSVIKEIEDDKKQDNFAERTLSSEPDLKSKLNQAESVPHLQNETDIQLSSQAADKYKDILNYLDNVEDSCDKTLLETRRSIPDSNRSEVEFVVEPDIAEDVPKLSDLLMLPNHQLARRIIALSLRANELANAVHLSKEHVMKIRAEKQKSIRTEKSNSNARMRDQKKHYESIVKRHQTFIEQLLKDKGSLCEKVAALTRRLESQNQAWEHKLETEITRVKETTMAGEKIRRERWVRENTKKIKELTVKGLEMEINKMNCNHQKEVSELKRSHQQQLLDALEEARIKHEQIENGIRESCANDREAIIEKERAVIRNRYERQLEKEHAFFEEQKQKLSDDFAVERERLENELKAKESDFQRKREEFQHEKESELEQVIAELQDKMSKQDDKYQNRINTIEKQYEADFEIWKKDFENNCKLAQVEKENTIRQHYRAERDRQIDAIVSRMDSEALKSTEEFELKMSRLKEKYEKDLQEVEKVEKSLREKYTETRSKMAEVDGQLRISQAELKKMQLELDHSQKMYNNLLKERDDLRENVRHEVQLELEGLKVERDGEIQQIHKRVQQAIEKKDATIDILQKENGGLRERCLKLEAVIRQQRKDYCVK